MGCATSLCHRADGSATDHKHVMYNGVDDNSGGGGKHTKQSRQHTHRSGTARKGDDVGVRGCATAAGERDDATDDGSDGKVCDGDDALSSTPPSRPGGGAAVPRDAPAGELVGRKPAHARGADGGSATDTPPPVPPLLDGNVQETSVDVVRAATPSAAPAPAPPSTMTFHDALLVISQQLAQRQRDGVSSITKEEMERLVLVTRELESLKQMMRRSKYTVVGTWNIIESENMLERLAQQLYDELLTHNPRLRVYFYGVDIEEQSRTLLRMLSTAVHFYDKPQAMVDMLMKAGARHRGYGVTRETFVSMKNAFMTVFPKFIGQDIYDAAEEEWQKFWRLILDLLEHGSCSAEGERYGRMYEEQNMKKLQSDFRLLLERQDRCDVRHQFAGIMFAKAMELYDGDVSRPEAQAGLRAGRQIVEALLDAVRHFEGKERAYASMRALGARHAAHRLVTRDLLQQLGEPFLYACRHFLEDEWNVAMESRFLALFQFMMDGVATGLDDAPAETSPRARNGSGGGGGVRGDAVDSRGARRAAAGGGGGGGSGSGSAAERATPSETTSTLTPLTAVTTTTPTSTVDTEQSSSSNSSGSGAASGATFCLLFTDIEASTRLWQKDADVMAAAVKEQQRVVRYLIAEYGAYEVKMVKDSFIVACKDVLVGAKLALAIQLELMRIAPIAEGFCMVDNTEGRGDPSAWDERTLRLRISLEHCTDAIATYDEKRNCYDYYGPSVNRCARMLSVTCGGQILMSQQTFEQLMAMSAFHNEPCPATLRDVQPPTADAELDDSALDHYVAVCDIGAVQLKGIGEPVRLVSMVPRCFVGRLFVDKIGKLAVRATT